MRRPKRHQGKRDLIKQHRMLKDMHRWMSDQHNRVKLDAIALRKKVITLTDDLQRRKSNDETIGRIIERAAMIDFNRCENGYYEISVRFNGDFMGGMSRFGEDIRYIAQDVARRIEHEIASSKFIQTAHMNDRRRADFNMRFQSAMGPPGPPDIRLGERGWMEGNSGH